VVYVSEFLSRCRREEYRGFFGFPNLPRKWNNGILEQWNIGFQKDISHFNFIVNPAGGGTINPTLHYPLRGGGQNPLFHYSIVPSFQL
jgi:hypothetical protein